MNQNEFNPVIKAVQSLRKLALEVKSDNDEIEILRNQIRPKIEEAEKMLLNTNDNYVSTVWIKNKENLLENGAELIKILNEIEQQFSKQNIASLSAIWKNHQNYKDLVLSNLSNLSNIGLAIFSGEKLNQWNLIWDEIYKILHKILSIGETYKLKFEMMESLNPTEVDSVTADILKHIPLDYSDEDAYQYEKEYMQAYEELKKSQSKNKNLWDKILDILAGGVEETPAHMVQMKRWLEGTKDN